MSTGLPEQEEMIRQRLIARWIRGKQGTARQIEGMATVVSGLRAALEKVIGKEAARATLIRAVALAEREHPVLANLRVADRGPELRQLGEELGKERPNRARDALIALLDKWLEVLRGLLGRAYLPLLQAVEADLASKEASPPGG